MFSGPSSPASKAQAASGLRLFITCCLTTRCSGLASLAAELGIVRPPCFEAKLRSHSNLHTQWRQPWPRRLRSLVRHAPCGGLVWRGGVAHRSRNVSVCATISDVRHRARRHSPMSAASSAKSPEPTRGSSRLVAMSRPQSGVLGSSWWTVRPQRKRSSSAKSRKPTRGKSRLAARATPSFNALVRATWAAQPLRP